MKTEKTTKEKLKQDTPPANEKKKTNEVSGKEISSEATAAQAKEKASKKTTGPSLKQTPSKAVKKDRITKVLFAVSEAQPFVSSGGLAEVAGSLPNALQETFDIRVVLPLYSAITAEYAEQMRFLCSFNLTLGWRNQYCGIFELKLNNVIYYFIDNKYYFGRGNLYGYSDDTERFAFFSKAVLSILPVIEFYPDIIHCNDWQTALVPVYLRSLFSSDERFKQIKTLFCIHNIEYQGKCDCYELGGLLGLDNSCLEMLRFEGMLNFTKGAIVCCDRLVTVSPTYAKELCYEFFASGLQDIIKGNKEKLSGILNGIDTVSYNPATDERLYARFDENNLSGKVINKLEVQRMLGLQIDETIPIVAMVSRLVSHKGLDLLRAVAHDILNERVQLIVVGKGDSLYETFLTDTERTYNNKMRAVIAFNSDLARKIYAGADFFLMPSKSEPCGLAQMISCRYGTVPIVRSTGGLADSIVDFDADSLNGNGYVFSNYNAHEMLGKIHSALENFSVSEKQNKLIVNCMRSDFSWSKSAKRYAELYQQMQK